VKQRDSARPERDIDSSSPDVLAVVDLDDDRRIQIVKDAAARLLTA
jgi:hypothetical protein